jgi:hypothetical protein
MVFLCFYLQEEIKILRISVFVNPYTEPDEEEEKAKEEEEKKDEDYVMMPLLVLAIAIYFLHVFPPIVLTLVCVNSG